jgi:hypothetical protein
VQQASGQGGKPLFSMHIYPYVKGVSEKFKHIGNLQFGVLHPVARALSRLSGKKLSFAATVQGVYCILYLDRYMLRPSLAIIRWHT